jgi:hypothetical protein
MLGFLRSRLSFANVVSCVALFVALGGSAIAAVVVSDNSQIAPNTIYGANAPPGKNDNVVPASLATSDLGALSVTSNKLADGAVLSSKLGAGSVTAGKLGSGAVGTSNLAAKAVTVPKLGDDVRALIDAQKGGPTQFTGTVPFGSNVVVKTIAGVDYTVQCTSDVFVSLRLSGNSEVDLDASGTASEDSTVEAINVEAGPFFNLAGDNLNFDGVARNRTTSANFAHVDVHVSATGGGCPYWGWALQA